MKAPWYVAGPLLGLSIVALRAALNRPLGVLGGYIDIADRRVSWRGPGIGLWVLVGFIIGGALFAVATGTFSISFSYPMLTWPGASPWMQFAVLAGAGVAMGFGARTASGCTSGHGLSGMSMGSPASFVATLTFFAAAVLLTHLLFAQP